LQLFKGEFVNHSGSKCCRKGLKGIICTQVEDEGLKIQPMFKKRADTVKNQLIQSSSYHWLLVKRIRS